MAVALAKAGADIVLVQRSTENKKTAQKIEQAGQKATIVVCDLADNAAVKGLIKKVVGKSEEGGLGLTLDIVVNCKYGSVARIGAHKLNSVLSGGGIQRRTPAENFSDEDWDDVIQVNLQAVWVIARDAGRHMLESRGGVSGGEAVAEGAADSNPRGRGKIINIASLISYQGMSASPQSPDDSVDMALPQVVSLSPLMPQPNTVSPD